MSSINLNDIKDNENINETIKENSEDSKLAEKEKTIEKLKKIIQNSVKKTINLEKQIKEQRLKIDKLEKEKNELEKENMDMKIYNEAFEKIINEKYEKVLKENNERVQDLYHKKFEEFKTLIMKNKKDWNNRNIREKNMSLSIISNRNRNANNNYSNNINNVDNIDNMDNIDNLNYSNSINIPQDVVINRSREITNKDEIFNNNKIYNNNKIINNNKHINNREFVTYERNVYDRRQNIYNNNNPNNRLNNINNNNNNLNNYNHNNLNNINNNNNNIIFNNINNFYNNMSNSFDYNLNKKNKNGYSFECINEKSLKTNILEGTKQAEIIIKLKNTSQQEWIKGIAKLIFKSSHLGNNSDIMLDTQKPEEIKKYKVVFKNISVYPEGDYYSTLQFNINGINIGKPIKLKVTIENKDNNKELEIEMNKYQKIIKDFKNEFNLINRPDEELLKILKKNDFNLNKSFQYLIN